MQRSRDRRQRIEEFHVPKKGRPAYQGQAIAWVQFPKERQLEETEENSCQPRDGDQRRDFTIIRESRCLLVVYFSRP